jgi:predicted DNA-binding protein (MmcQ/YjbR family)
MAKASPFAAAEKALRAHALSYPEAQEEFPWGERVVKVKGKIFVFLGRPDGELSLSVKLPGSATLALDLPFASPTAYGLGKSGWVTARFAPGDDPPLPVLRQWIDESYRAVAPKRLVAQLSPAPRAAAGDEPRGRASRPAKRAAAAAGARPHSRPGTGTVNSRPDPGEPPELESLLGARHAVYRELLSRFGSLAREWKVYSRKAGPSLRLKRAERAILYVQPGPGTLQATVVLGEKAVEQALASRLPARLRKAIEDARPYVEGRPVRVDLRSAADIGDVETLVGFKG